MKDKQHSKKIYSSMVQNSLHFQQKIQNHLPVRRLRVPLHRMQEQIQLYNWRNRHQLSLISYQWISIEPFSDKEVVLVAKCTQLLTPLSDIKQIKGKNTIRNVSKIFDSFQLLFEKFGPFQLSSDMIAYDSFHEPFVWMNSDHSLNEYKRDHVSEQDFAQNLLNLLLKNRQKFSEMDLADQCYLARGMRFTLSSMKQHFLDVNNKTVNENSISKTNQHQCSLDCTLFFKKTSKLKRRQTNPPKDRKDSNSSNMTYPPTVLISTSRQQINKSSSFKNFFKEFREDIKFCPTASTLPVDSEHEDSFTAVPQRPSMDDSFSFEQDLSHLKVIPQNRLTISVNLCDDQPEPKAEESLNVSILDKYMRVVVSSIIHPEVASQME